MLPITLMTTGAALGAFVVYFALVAYEAKRGARVVLPRVRGWIDERLRLLRSRLLGVQNAPLWFTVHMQAGVNRARSQKASRPVDQPRAFATKPRSLRSRGTTRLAEPTSNPHFAALHEHRTDTALSEEEKTRRRNQTLEERF